MSGALRAYPWAGGPVSSGLQAYSADLPVSTWEQGCWGSSKVFQGSAA